MIENTCQLLKENLNDKYVIKGSSHINYRTLT